MTNNFIDITPSINPAKKKAKLKEKTNKLVSKDKELFANLSKEEITTKKKERAKKFREANKHLLKKNEIIDKIIPVKLGWCSKPTEPNEYGNGGGEYTPDFDDFDEGDIMCHGSSYGLGVFEKNGKFYFATCNTGNREIAFQIPEILAFRISEHINSGNSDPLVEQLWSYPTQLQLEKIFNSFSKKI